MSYSLRSKTSLFLEINPNNFFSHNIRPSSTIDLLPTWNTSKPNLNLNRTVSLTSSVTIASNGINIGAFARLAPEIWEIIWRNLLPSPASDRKGDQAVLRTGHQLCDQISTYIYDNEVLTFHITPTCKPQHWITVSNVEGPTWELADLGDAESRGFRHLPYRKLESIKIQIQPPDHNDTSEMVCLWKNVTDLVETLHHVDGMQSIELCLQNTSERT
jgi:hypothetical protein